MMSEEMKAKRENLKELSRTVANAVKYGQFPTINAALVNLYQQQGHTEIHSFKAWLSNGMVVKKGEKALLLWGEPRHGGKQEKEETTADDDEYKFFPLAYVFSQLQVQPLKQAS